jgi:hypothetical protein
MRPEVASLVPGRLVAVPAALAVAAEATAWGMAALPGTLTTGWYAAPRLLAAVHLLTLGALAMSIVGFGWQLVPVVTAEAPPRGWAAVAGVVNALVGTGVALLFVGMVALPMRAVAGLGGGLVVAGLLLRSGAVVFALVRAKGRVPERGWLLAAELCLLAGLALGAGLLAGRLGHPVLDDPIRAIGWHAALLLFGWVGGWIGGMGAILLPMFAVAPAPKPAALLLAGGAWFAGLALGAPWLWALGAATLGGALLWSLHRRLHRRAPAGVGTAALGLAALVGLALLVGQVAPLGIAAGALVLFALPVLRGVSLRIAPFLVWSHQLAHDIRRAPEVGSLVPRRAAVVAGALSVLGGGLVVAGMATGHIGLARIGAALALVGTLAHAAVLATALTRASLARNRLAALPGMETR